MTFAIKRRCKALVAVRAPKRLFALVHPKIMSTQLRTLTKRLGASIAVIRSCGGSTVCGYRFNRPRTSSSSMDTTASPAGIVSSFSMGVLLVLNSDLQLLLQPVLMLLLAVRTAALAAILVASVILIQHLT